MSVELKQYCPYCSGKIAYPQELAGTATHCPHCRREVVLAKDIRQECRACGEEVVFSESMVGEQTRCPGCGKSMKLHRPASEALLSPGSTQETGAAKSQYYLAMRGKTEGPFTEAEVCNYINKNWVRGDSRVQVGTGGAWFVLSQFQQFTASLMKQNAPKAVEEETFVDEGPPEIMLRIDGQHYGPYTVGQMRHALKTGAVTSDIEAQRPGMPGWNPLKKWPEFKGMGAEKQSLGGVVQMSSRNPHAIDCFGSGLIMVVLFLALFTTGYSTVNPIMDPKIPIVLTWVLFFGWLFGRALLIKDSANLGEGFGSLGLFEMAFKVYFIIMVIFAARGLIMVIFALAKGGETFLLTMMLWSMNFPFLYLNWHGVRGMKRYFHEYDQSGIDLAMVIIGSIPLILVNGLQILLVIIIFRGCS